MTNSSKPKIFLTEKEKKFLKKWELIRLNKWRYIIRLTFWLGIFLALVAYLVNIKFRFAEFDTVHFLQRAVLSLIMAAPLAYFQFKGQDKRYREVKDNHMLDE